MSTIRSVLAVAVALVVVANGAVAAAGGINFGADITPDPYVDHTVEKANHEVGWSATQYENDAGETAHMNAQVNRSADNPFSFVATDVELDDFGAFPHAEDNTSALDAAEWSTSPDMSVSDVETAPNVDAARFQTSGLASGATENATFGNFSVTSDESKRYLALGLDISTLESSSSVEIRVVDEDGDYKTAEINSSRSSGDDFIANATGEGYVYQEQLGNLATTTVGDGTFDNIETVEVHVFDGNADLSIMLLNIEKMSPYQFGVEQYQADDDDELETREITSVRDAGPISIYELDSIGSSFSNAVIHDLAMETHARAADLAGEDVQLETTVDEDETYPGYYGTATVYYRLSLEDAYDLRYSGAELVETQSVVSDRILGVEYAEGVSDDTAFDEIDDNAWTDKSDLYSSEGTNVPVDSTIQPGQNLVLKYEFRFNEAEFNAIQSSSSSTPAEDGGGGGPLFGGGDDSGGPISWILAGLTALLGSLAIFRRGD